ncbi:hypothetical protein Tco_0294849 [Tanacetum coccineum]
MHTRASNSELVEPLLEPERTLNRRRRRRNRRVPFNQRNNPPKNPRIVYPPILDINHFRHFLVTLENLFPMDDEPMWAADHVVAPTPGSAITIPETANEFAIKGTLLCVTPLPKNIAVRAKKVSNTKFKADRSKPTTSHSVPKSEQSVESSNSVRRPKSKDTKSNNIVLKNTNDKRPSAHVRKMSSSANILSGCSKHMTGNLSLLRNFVKKFMGTVRFGNDHFAAIPGYGDYVQGNLTICHIYYVEGLERN